jgi:hypothetical protein
MSLYLNLAPSRTGLSYRSCGWNRKDISASTLAWRKCLLQSEEEKVIVVCSTYVLRYVSFGCKFDFKLGVCRSGWWEKRASIRLSLYGETMLPKACTIQVFDLLHLEEKGQSPRGWGGGTSHGRLWMRKSRRIRIYLRDSFRVWIRGCFDTQNQRQNFSCQYCSF